MRAALPDRLAAHGAGRVWPDHAGGFGCRFRVHAGTVAGIVAWRKMGRARGRAERAFCAGLLRRHRVDDWSRGVCRSVSVLTWREDPPEIGRNRQRRIPAGLRGSDRDFHPSLVHLHGRDIPDHDGVCEATRG